MSERVPAVVVRAGEGERIRAAGAEHLFKLTGELTTPRASDYTGCKNSSRFPKGSVA